MPTRSEAAALHDKPVEDIIKFINGIEDVDCTPKDVRPGSAAAAAAKKAKPKHKKVKVRCAYRIFLKELHGEMVFFIPCH